MWGGAKPIDLTDFVSNSVKDLASQGTITVPITKEPRYVWYEVVSADYNNFIQGYFVDVKNGKTLRMLKNSGTGDWTISTLNNIISQLTIDMANMTVSVYNNSSGTRSIGVSVIY